MFIKRRKFPCENKSAEDQALFTCFLFECLVVSGMKTLLLETGAIHISYEVTAPSSEQVHCLLYVFKMLSLELMYSSTLHLVHEGEKQNEEGKKDGGKDTINSLKAQLYSFKLLTGLRKL